MDRRPIYAKGNGNRIVSRPNGLWVLQSPSGGKGTRTFDPWDDVGRPADYERAFASLEG